ncbi:porin [Janthinobacterium sp. Marseille]|nr:porin [Janthinobacterium sp. Marseille]ABR90203.1 porin [Janthinobacterium sp. Marseille]
MKAFAMQGLALAAMLACGTASQAQSSVQVYGLIDVALAYDKQPGKAGVTGVENGKMTTSYLGLKGSEDLGGGLSTIFALESYFRADTGSNGRFDGDGFWTRSSYVGLQGRFGSVRLGRNSVPLFISTLLFNPFGDSFGYSPSIRHYFASGTVTGDSGWSDSIAYVSPNFSGLTVNLIAAAGEGNGGPNVGGSVLYTKGPLGLTAVYQRVRKGAAIADTTTWQLGSSYDFDVVKVFAQYGQVKNVSAQPDIEYKLTDLGVAIPLGGGKVLAAYGLLDPVVGAKRETLSLGYDYNLSKRTDVYLVLMRDELDALSAGKSLAVGIRHRF